MKTAKILFVPCALFIAAACGDTRVDNTIEYVDEGAICLFADEAGSRLMGGGEQSFAAGSKLVVTVSADDCLSSSCDINRVANCSIKRNGSVLNVESYLAFEEVEQQYCTMDCGALIADCESEPLEEGSYTVHFGGDSHTLTVPSSFQACQ